MGVPEFDESGFLPDGVHSCDMAELRERFVDGFPSSASRRLIYTGYDMLRERSETIGISAVEWIDGSFVRDKPDPGDIDVIHFVDAELINQMPPDSVACVAHELSGFVAKGRHLTHSIWVPVFPVGHQNYPLYLRARAHWRKWWGGTRGLLDAQGTPYPSRSKGFVKDILGNPDLVPAVSEERGYVA